MQNQLSKRDESQEKPPINWNKYKVREKIKTLVNMTKCVTVDSSLVFIDPTILTIIWQQLKLF